jgi:hypothetical protein
MARVKVSRTILYEGDADWVHLVLAKSLMQPGKKFQAGIGNCIELLEQRETIDAVDTETLKEFPNG